MRDNREMRAIDEEKGQEQSNHESSLIDDFQAIIQDLNEVQNKNEVYHYIIKNRI